MSSKNDARRFCHPPLSFICPKDVWMPCGWLQLISILLFLFVTLLPKCTKSLSCEVAWLKKSTSPSSVAHPHWALRRRLLHREDTVPCDTWPPRAKGRALLAVVRSHHSLMTGPLWCPLDGMSVNQGGKSISNVQRKWRCFCYILIPLRETLYLQSSKLLEMCSNNYKWRHTRVCFRKGDMEQKRWWSKTWIKISVAASPGDSV